MMEEGIPPMEERKVVEKRVKQHCVNHPEKYAVRDGMCWACFKTKNGVNPFKRAVTKQATEKKTSEAASVEVSAPPLSTVIILERRSEVRTVSACIDGDVFTAKISFEYVGESNKIDEVFVEIEGVVHKGAARWKFIGEVAGAVQRLMIKER